MEKIRSTSAWFEISTPKDCIEERQAKCKAHGKLGINLLKNTNERSRTNERRVLRLDKMQVVKKTPHICENGSLGRSVHWMTSTEVAHKNMHHTLPLKWCNTHAKENTYRIVVRKGIEYCSYNGHSIWKNGPNHLEASTECDSLQFENYCDPFQMVILWRDKGAGYLKSQECTFEIADNPESSG